MSSLLPSPFAPSVAPAGSDREISGDRPRVGTVVEVLHLTLLAVAVLFILGKSALEFFPQWDALTYHLPSALSLYGLTTYTPEPWIQHMLGGIPILPHRLQGLLVLLTHRLSCANLINPCALLLTAVSIGAATRNKHVVKWFLTACLAVPLLVIHNFTSYVDLWTGAFLATAFVWLARLFEAAWHPQPSDRPVLWTTFCLGGLAVAFNSKYQAWPLTAVLIAWLIAAIFTLRQHRRACRRCALVLLLAAPLFLVHPVRNYLTVGNPTSPIANPVLMSDKAGITINPSNVNERHLQMPKLLWEVSEPTRFVFSALEITRFLDSRFTLRWSLDQMDFEYGNNSPNHRMGGWFYGTVLVLLGGIALGVFKRQLPLPPVAIFGSLVAVTAFMPQSHELRYWLCLPLVAAFLAAQTLAGPASRAHVIGRIALAGCAIFVMTRVLWPFGIDPAPASDYAPDEARAFWQAMEQRPDGRNLQVRVAATPSTIFWAGPEFNSYHVEEAVHSK